MRKNNISGLPLTSKQIPNSKDYIDIDGSVYTPVTNYKGLPSGQYVRKTCRINPRNGYVYCGIYDNHLKYCKQRRVHRIVAEVFIPNPQNLPVVGHRNNIKSRNNVENLYWTTYSENTKKAVDDGLLVNDKGADDSQSKPVAMYNTITNECQGVYGSITEAALQTGLSKTTISRQAKYHRPVRKEYYFRYLDDDSTPPQTIVAMRDYSSDNIIDLFANASSASAKTGVNPKTISQQCRTGKPKHKFSNVYFGFVDSKCEQTIESSTQVE